MKYEDYEKAILDLVQHPETAPVNAQSVLKEIKSDVETIDALTNKTQEQEQKIRDVQDTNIKMLLHTVGARPEAKEDEGDGHIHTREDADAFFEQLKADAAEKAEKGKE